MRGKELTIKSERGQELVVVPLKKYLSLLEYIEDLEDLCDHIVAMEEYKLGKGRSLREFLSKHRRMFDLSG